MTFNVIMLLAAWCWCQHCVAVCRRQSSEWSFGVAVSSQIQFYSMNSWSLSAVQRRSRDMRPRC